MMGGYDDTAYIEKKRKGFAAKMTAELQFLRFNSENTKNS